MDECELEVLLKHLISTWENEIIEFKEADNNYSTDRIGSYVYSIMEIPEVAKRNSPVLQG